MNARQILGVIGRNLLAHSPRLYCANCKGLFLLARLDVKATDWNMARCPLCGGSGPFREPSPEELAAAVPESKRKWPVAAVISVCLVMIFVYIWWYV